MNFAQIVFATTNTAARLVQLVSLAKDFLLIRCENISFVLVARVFFVVALDFLINSAPFKCDVRSTMA